MLTEAWNPDSPDMTATLVCLNRCFDDGWDEALYRWYLARPFNGRAPDSIVISNDGAPVAGSVINYRQLRATDGSIRDIGIASGSWTLPEARGKGLFTRMMQASVSRAGEKGCQYFLAFVTSDNASRNALERCGALMIPAAYVVGDGAPDTGGQDAPVETVDVSPADLFESAAASSAVRFHYESAAAWAAQHVDRPLPVDVCRVHGTWAIIEKTNDTDRLQWTAAEPRLRHQVAATLATRAAAEGRKFFMYTTQIPAPGGFASRPGFICCLPTGSGDPDPLSDLGADWDIQSADRM